MPKVAYQIVIKDIIYKALISSSMLKAPRFDKINFCILYIVWDWNSKRIIAIV